LQTTDARGREEGRGGRRRRISERRSSSSSGVFTAGERGRRRGLLISPHSLIIWDMDGMWWIRVDLMPREQNARR
jgi:hypothetical protein